jgi:carbonic anhydrase
LRESPIVRRAPRPPQVHGWIFGLRAGLITQLTDMDQARDIAGMHAGMHADAHPSVAVRDAA